MNILFQIYVFFNFLLNIEQVKQSQKTRMRAEIEK